MRTVTAGSCNKDLQVYYEILNKMAKREKAKQPRITDDMVKAMEKSGLRKRQ